MKIEIDFIDNLTEDSIYTIYDLQTDPFEVGMEFYLKFEDYYPNDLNIKFVDWNPNVRNRYIAQYNEKSKKYGNQKIRIISEYKHLDIKHTKLCIEYTFELVSKKDK